MEFTKYGWIFSMSLPRPIGYITYMYTFVLVPLGQRNCSIPEDLEHPTRLQGNPGVPNQVAWKGGNRSDSAAPF